MSYHIVTIDAPECSLSCRDGQLTCSVPGEAKSKTIPLEDVASIVITSFSASLHSHLLVEAAKHGVALVFCESFKPISLLLPANRATDTLLTRAQVDLAKRERDTLWRRTVDAKCGNQLALAEHLIPQHSRLRELESAARGKHAHKEAITARYYWGIYGDALGIPDFSRERSSGGVNALLNYGYAVLLSSVLQKLFGVGLDPTFGIAHVVRERSTPLAYDLMEPWRPCVDWRVAQWVRDHPDFRDHAVTPEFRRWVTGFPLVEVDYLGLTLDIIGCIEGVIRSFRKAVTSNRPGLYQPWTPKNSKWAGSW